MEDLSFVEGLGGAAIGGSCVGYIVPSLFYMKTFRPEIEHTFAESTWKGIKSASLPVLCLLFGIFALFAGTVMTLLSAF